MLYVMTRLLRMRLWRVTCVVWMDV
eukprot:COSAG06_NODE_78399_length_110_cov_2914.272727_1_plen_24_part_10